MTAWSLQSPSASEASGILGTALLEMLYEIQCFVNAMKLTALSCSECFSCCFKDAILSSHRGG